MFMAVNSQDVSLIISNLRELSKRVTQYTFDSKIMMNKPYTFPNSSQLYYLSETDTHDVNFNSVYSIFVINHLVVILTIT